MAIPTVAEWKKWRDAAGGKGSLVRGTSMTDLLTAYWKAYAGETIMEKRFNSLKQLNELDRGVKTYRKALKPTDTKMITVIDGIQRDIDSLVKTQAEMANPVIKLHAYIVAILKEAPRVAQSRDPQAYYKLWNNEVRGFGTQLPKLMAIDPVIKKDLTGLHKLWTDIASEKWSQATLAGANVPAEEGKQNVHVAAVKIQKLAENVDGYFREIQAWR